VKLEREANLLMGGGGSLIHAKSIIGKYCMIGFGATLANGPIIGDYVYISPGVRIAKKVCIGNFCIIGANAVVNKDLEPFTIAAGVPARQIGKVTPSNLDKYLIPYFASTDKTNNAFIEMVKLEFLRQYNGK
jgi:acetyltransferase-like isoleucine patch superfamily enzyme